MIPILNVKIIKYCDFSNWRKENKQGKAITDWTEWKLVTSLEFPSKKIH